MFRNNLPFFAISFSFIMFIKRYLKMTCVKTRCTFGDLFLSGRNVEEVTFFSGGYILYERSTVPVKMVYNWVRGWTMDRPGSFWPW